MGGCQRTWVVRLMILGLTLILVSSSIRLLQLYPDVAAPSAAGQSYASGCVIHVAVLLKGLDQNSANGHKLRILAKRWISSLVTRSKRMAIKIIFITDPASIKTIGKLMEQALPPFPLWVLDSVHEWAKKMKVYFNHFNSSSIMVQGGHVYQMDYPDKYDSDLFYVHPFYHRIFPHLDRLIVTDVDVEFQSDPAVLFDELALFSVEQLLGAANDQSPHYSTMLAKSGYLKRNPDTALGRPGHNQGLNVGLMLLRLDKMRTSAKWSYYLSEEGVTHLAQHYGFTDTHLGAQDWVTLLQFEAPELIYVLGCHFNRQLSQEYRREPWLDQFEEYHSCNLTPIHVLHGNGDSFV